MTESDFEPDAAANGWYSDENATFGDRLADAREAVGMSQEDLARRLGIKLRTLQGWEQDLAEPRANRLQMLSGLLNVSLRWLLTGEGEGLEKPSDAAPLPEDMARLLGELRQMRADLARTSDRIGHMEKRLRAAFSESA
ncbi:XRE family transcriptional regulator [Mesobaculum littorinae]|uniref:XRE family transcriptional regulator n=1 Tax=Mesobaculum littorinae TaxID=2486419 RepID=A0A438AIJ4_9RHOB|nr:helix-turn-helix transcriptional regulator [Mesobaculum littorinae]RVV98407.1 XRE family transcriptional regulator [Mesobaculum littorinae]